MSINGQSFEEKLAFGQEAESAIVKWLMKKKGYSIIPVYDIKPDTGAGPRFFGVNGNHVAPDILAFCGQGNVLWIEAKHKKRFSWTGWKAKRGDPPPDCWVTGFDIKYFEHYQKVSKETGLDVVVLFLHSCEDTDPDEIKLYKAPPKCPTGLFARNLDHLAGVRSHTHDGRDRNGVRYKVILWSQSMLKCVAPIEQVIRGHA